MTPFRVSVSVMGHPSRAHLVGELAEKLGHPAEVVYDERNVEWDTGRRSWLAYDPAASHHMVVQDDAVVCRDLVAGVAELVVHTGDKPVCLYTGKQGSGSVAGLVAVARAQGMPFFEWAGPNWGVGVVMPTSLIDAMVAGCDAIVGCRQYDTLMTRWFRRQKISCLYTVPSLVDHRQDTPSLLGHGPHNRSALGFIGADASALDVDWGAQGTPEPACGYFPLTIRGRPAFVCCHCQTWRPREREMQAHLRRHHRELVSA